MVKKLAVIFSIFILAVISVLSYRFVSNNSIHKIQSVNMAYCQNGYIYGIDMASNKYYIFRYNIESGENDYFTYPIEYNDNMVVLNNMVMGSDGNIYIHRSQYETEREEYVDTIDYCNFNSGCLDTLWNITDITDEPFFIFNLDKYNNTVLTTFDSNSFIIRQYILNSDNTASKIIETKIQNSANLIYGGKNRFFILTINGDISTIDETGKERMVFINDGSQIGTQNVNYEVNENELHFLNLDTGYNYKITKETNYEKVELCFEHKAAYAKSFNASKMYNINESDGIYCGVLPLEDGRNVPAVCGQKEYVLDELTWTDGQVIFVSAIMSLSIFAVLAVYFYIFYIIWNRKYGAPILAIATMLIIPIIAVGTAGLFYFIDKQPSNEKEQKIQELAVISEEIKENINIELFELYRQKDRITIDELISMNKSFKKTQDLDSLKSNDNKNNYYITPNMYFYKNGDIYSASHYYQLGVPVKYQVTSNVYDCLKEAAEENKVVYTEYNDISGRFISVFTPIENSSGEVIGVLEINENIIVLELNIMNNAITIKKLLLAAASMIFILIQIVLWINTRSLKVLRQAMTEAANGNLHSRANIKGNHEIAVIADKFDKMAEVIENRVSEIETFQKKYEAFVPSKLFYILRKNGIKGAFAGDGKNFTATVMAVNSAGYKKAVLNKYDEVFSYSNKYLPKEIPIIHSFGGVVRRIFEGGEETIFTKEAKNNTAECAVELMQKLNDSNEGFCIGIAKEDLRFGVIGLPKRMVAITISEHGSLSWFLQNMASDFGASILISSGAANDIEDFFKRYSIRTIGYLYITAESRLEAVYEILNGESQERQRLKLDTKAEFEEGVRLFMAESFIYARKRFINVLQRDSKDKAAKEYIILCDKSLKGEIVKPWLKKF